MRRKQVNINSYLYLIHPEIANYPIALDVDGPLIRSGSRNIDTYLALYPPTFAIIEDQTYLVAHQLSLHLNLRMLGRTRFVAAICDSWECSQHSDVAQFSVYDSAAYRGLISVLTPSYVSRPTVTRKKAP